MEIENISYAEQILIHNWCANHLINNSKTWTNEQLEQFLRDNAPYVEWYYVTENFDLTESFIREVREFVYWPSVFEKQIYHLNREFLNEIIENFDQFKIFLPNYRTKVDTIRYIRRRIGETQEVK